MQIEPVQISLTVVGKFGWARAANHCFLGLLGTHSTHAIPTPDCYSFPRFVYFFEVGYQALQAAHLPQPVHSQSSSGQKRFEGSHRGAPKRFVGLTRR